MKKIINDPLEVVEEMLDGLCAVYGGIQRLPDTAVAVRAGGNANSTNHVALISGGGSGHEPADAGYIGRGCYRRRCSVMSLPLPVPTPLWRPSARWQVTQARS